MVWSSLWRTRVHWCSKIYIENSRNIPVRCWSYRFASPSWSSTTSGTRLYVWTSLKKWCQKNAAAKRFNSKWEKYRTWWSQQIERSSLKQRWRRIKWCSRTQRSIKIFATNYDPIISWSFRQFNSNTNRQCKFGASFPCLRG